MTDDRADLMILASDPAAGLALLEAADNERWASLMRGLLGLLDAASREILSDLGLLAVCAELETIANASSASDERNAAGLIVAHSTWNAPDVEATLRGFAAADFNDTLSVLDANERHEATVLAIVAVWRSVLPVLFSGAGREILRRVVW